LAKVTSVPFGVFMNSCVFGQVLLTVVAVVVVEPAVFVVLVVVAAVVAALELALV